MRERSLCEILALTIMLLISDAGSGSAHSENCRRKSFCLLLLPRFQESANTYTSNILLWAKIVAVLY